ncbi:maleylacetate reductase [Piscinibacter sakaiensis]|uniref:maleylacetate reductase n=1 Tax=Piscinibacter sakaiensis TaxID=1547922 RepID=A0A0K8P0N5_PISS1|nr:maleylacetate reductase [Piscinibacter sakaiensis]GAP36188.1 alcohol dehydrogenase [Piscinibacter sakaiensis]
MEAFVYTAQPARVVFGAGALQHLGAEVERLGARRALVLSTPEQAAQARRVAEQLGARAAGVYAGAVMHVPVETARAAVAEAARLGADCAVAIGGGSTTGLGKAIALESGLPILAIPTTYAGSEMTPIFGLTEGGVKRTGRDPRVLPRTVIYDPELSLGLPPGLSVTSGINAMAHAAEGLYAHDGNPVTALMAEEGLRAMAAALPRLVRDPADRAARGDALYAAWLCGTVLGAVAMGLHHKLCHTLGGSFELPHAEVHTVVLPHALAYNAAHAPQAMARIARALGAAAGAGAGAVVDAPQALFEQAQALGAPTSLRALGLPAEALDRAADLAAANPYPNPRPLDRGALRALLQRAWDGAAPQA